MTIKPEIVFVLAFVGFVVLPAICIMVGHWAGWNARGLREDLRRMTP